MKLSTKQAGKATERDRLSEDSRQEILNLARPKPLRSVMQYVTVFCTIGVAIYLEHLLGGVLVTIVAIVFIAGRQHSLYVLNHDASHYGLFKKHQTNKIVGTWLSNLVMFHHPEAWSFVQWRRVHMLHHAHLFTKKDPNYVGREMQGDTNKPLTVPELIKRCLLAGLLSAWGFFTSRQDYVCAATGKCEKRKMNHLRALLMPFPGDPEMNREWVIKIIFSTIAITLVSWFDLWYQFLVLWIVPMYTAYPMILTYYDLTEHRWTSNSLTMSTNCRSVRLGMIGRVLTSFLPRGLHLEHHVFPNVVACDLPKLSLILQHDGAVAKPQDFNGLLKDLRQVQLRHEYQS